ncbi:hypothetical protein [Phytohabitans aurantiacus]|uniref:Uncharacterized protein n=1 Tax=Phytohabitans aurantiacus TaxID=3016789 RepID=A0ABQ5R0I8_9ACTN|nr:hypothetical protein [Phytohabitans aurantiacus]GLI00319.1 hypothetical protein Pa4123_55950 [Phytohabitans aurantiacus]
MSDPQPYGEDEWRERLHAAVEATLRRKAARKAFHDGHQARRDAGLRQRHAEKIARADDRLRQAQQDGHEDSWYEEP